MGSWLCEPVLATIVPFDRIEIYQNRRMISGITLFEQRRDGQEKSSDDQYPTDDIPAHLNRVIYGFHSDTCQCECGEIEHRF